MNKPVTNVSNIPAGAGRAAPSAPPAQTNSPLGPKDNPEVLHAIQDIERQMTELEAARKGINDQLSALREQLKARSIDRDAFRAARAQKQLNPNRREAFDVDMVLCRKAFDLPIQPGLFEDAPTAKVDAGRH